MATGVVQVMGEGVPNREVALENGIRKLFEPRSRNWDQVTAREKRGPE